MAAIPPKEIFERALQAEGVTGPMADLARSIFQQESAGGRITTTTNHGARGFMQILPGTFKEVADKDWNIQDPLQNSRAGIRYLQKMNRNAGGDLRLTAIGYYSGPGGMRAAREGVARRDSKNPNAPDTFKYADQVLARMPSGSRAPVAPPAAPAQGAAFGRYPSSGSARQPVVVPPEVRSEAMPAVGPVAYKDEAPLPVVAEAALPAFDSTPNAWAEFQRTYQAQAPVQAANMAWGELRSPQVAVPDYLDTVAQAPAISPNFSAFGSIGRRARV